MNGLTVPSPWFTGKSLSEALIFESTNPQYDNRLFIALQVEYMKIPSSKLGRTCCVQKLFLTFRTIFVLNLFFPCSAKRRASDKDLPVQKDNKSEESSKQFECHFYMGILAPRCTMYQRILLVKSMQNCN